MTDAAVPERSITPHRPPRVLLADDSSEQRWTLRLALSMMGFDVTEAANGRELFWALEELSRKARSEPSLVIADVYMPSYDGLEVLEAWRDAVAGRAVIFITAFPDAVVARRVQALGAELLAKPFTLSAFSECVRGVLRRSRAPS
ncbi:MAG TPA: response regulator [Polyangiaceae bacterium]|nr:response regulator [Polyangiaceae bacterium]